LQEDKTTTCKLHQQEQANKQNTLKALDDGHQHESATSLNGCFLDFTSLIKAASLSS